MSSKPHPADTCPQDYACRFSFDDLQSAAVGRAMTGPERTTLYALPQAERNAWVRERVDQTAGRFACEDRLGADGITYTAFWEVPRPA